MKVKVKKEKSYKLVTAASSHEKDEKLEELKMMTLLEAPVGEPESEAQIYHMLSLPSVVIRKKKKKALPLPIRLLSNKILRLLYALGWVLFTAN